MKIDASNSVSGSADESSEKSPSAPGGEQSASLTEAQLLQQEVARARAAIGDAFSNLGRSLKATADPHLLTREHPWIAISTAAVAGFAAAVTLIPSKQQQALRALAELERARHAPPPPAVPTSDKSPSSGGVVGTILAEAIKTLRPLVTTLLSAGIARATSGSADGTVAGGPASGNGHSGDDSISTPS